MGTGEESSPAKPSKSTPTQETPPPSYPDWASSMQAYYSSGAAQPFFTSTVTPPIPHPYMWGGQHPVMPPYGTPVPYPSVYPPAGVYGHPSMPMTSIEMETKAPNGKDKVNRKSKGNGKTASSSGNDGGTQSAESENDGSSDASNDNNQQENSGGKKGSFHQMLADANARNNNSGPNVQTSVPGNSVASMPATNLHMGMDLWNPPTGSRSMKMQMNHAGVSQPVAPPPMMADPWVQQDERELKRQKRKQSNRESARRSRLRKQAECEELQARVETLNNQNQSLRDELKRLSEECGKLTSENDSIKDELTRLYGPEAVSKLGTHLPSQSNEGDS
ncbi:hypothetical protein R6Q57_021167 [Mikania cordata]